MYEVEFDVSGGFGGVFSSAGIKDFGSLGAVNSGIWNGMGSAPARPNGSAPAYQNTARGPVEMTTGFQVNPVTLTFPPYIVPAGNKATKHYLSIEVVKFFEACEELRKFPHLAPDAQFGMVVRRIFEENDPGDERNQRDATRLYNAQDDYPKVSVVYAGGDDQAYSVTLNVLQRPKRTKIGSYKG